MRDRIIVDAFRVIDSVREKLIGRIEKQSNWGKNQLLLEVERAINDAIIDNVEFAVEMDNMPA